MKITKEQVIEIIAKRIGKTIGQTYSGGGSMGGGGISISIPETNVVDPKAMATFLVEEGIVKYDEEISVNHA